MSLDCLKCRKEKKLKTVMLRRQIMEKNASMKI